MKVQDWIFSIRYTPSTAHDPHRSFRFAIVGPARASTVDTLLHQANVPVAVRTEIRADETVRKFVEGLLDPDASGYYTASPIGSPLSWCVCIGSVQGVIQ